eukprot:7039873-Pyramimonas_sp.AAC.1
MRCGDQSDPPLRCNVTWGPIGSLHELGLLQQVVPVADYIPETTRVMFMKSDTQGHELEGHELEVRLLPRSSYMVRINFRLYIRKGGQP